jgi:hypothetical protein
MTDTNTPDNTVTARHDEMALELDAANAALGAPKHNAPTWETVLHLVRVGVLRRTPEYDWKKDLESAHLELNS